MNKLYWLGKQWGLLRSEIYTSDVFYGSIKQESSIIVFSLFIPHGCGAAAIKYSIDWLWRRHSGCKDLHVTRATLLAEIANGATNTFFEEERTNYFKSFLITTKQDTTTRGEIFAPRGARRVIPSDAQSQRSASAGCVCAAGRSGKIHLENEISRSNPTKHTRPPSTSRTFLSVSWWVTAVENDFPPQSLLHVSSCLLFCTEIKAFRRQLSHSGLGIKVFYIWRWKAFKAQLEMNVSKFQDCIHRSSVK